jgi:hypothetical protein
MGWPGINRTINDSASWLRLRQNDHWRICDGEWAALRAGCHISVALPDDGGRSGKEPMAIMHLFRQTSFHSTRPVAA